MSCGGDATAPGSGKQSPLVVTLSALPASAPTISDSPNGPLISCDINLTATATGTGHATWGDATTLWYIGRDRTSSSVGTTTNPADEVVQGFGGATGIDAGASQHTTWYFYDSVPFTVSIGFAYHTDDGRTGLASARFTCGPDPANAVLPTITQITLPSTTGELKLGDTVAVHVKAASSSGIWATVIDASGAFLAEKLIGEHLAPNVDQTVNFVVASANPGVPLTISVSAFNDALEGVSTSVETQLKFVDRTPPSIANALISGQYAVGDTFTIAATATDDNKLGWLVYQIGAPANIVDSAAANPDSATETITAKVVVQPSWVGTPSVSIAVRDAGGLTSQTVTSAPDSVRFYPVVGHPTTAPLALSVDAPNDMVYDAKRDLVYIGTAGGQLIALSPSTLTRTWTVTMPDVGYGMDLSEGGDSLLVAIPVLDEIAVYDLTNPAATPRILRLSVLDTIQPANPGQRPAPSGLRILAGGRMFVTLTNPTLSYQDVVEVDLATGAQTLRTDSQPWGNTATFWKAMARPADRSRLEVFGTCWAQYDVTSDSFTNCSNPFGLPFNGSGISFDATGALAAYADAVMNVATRTVWRASTIDTRTQNIAISPDAASVYLAVGQDLRTMRWSDRVMLERTPLPLTPGRFFVGPDGRWILAFDTSNGTRVTRIDLP